MRWTPPTRSAQTEEMRDGLLQRSLELTVLERQLQQVRAGAGRVILVQGPAGVGKSSLLRAAAQSAERCAGAGADRLGRSAGTAGRLGRRAPVLRPDRCRPGVGAPRCRCGGARAAGSRPRSLRPAPTGDAVHAATYGLSWLAYGLAERAPTLLVVDDVHWADGPSLRWLAQLSGHLADLRLGLLCAVRSGEPATDLATLADLIAAAGAAALGPDAIRSGPAADRPVAACHAASAGNPLPRDQVRRVEPTSEVRASTRPSRWAGGSHGGRACRHLPSPCSARSGSPGPRRCRHRRLPDGERSLLHRRAAKVLAADRVDVETVGLHLLHTEPAGEPHTVSTLRSAAERANRRGAPESAAGFLRRALLEPPVSRALAADLHSELGLCLSAQVRPGSADLLADAVELRRDA